MCEAYLIEQTKKEPNHCRNSASFFGSSKRAEKAAELKQQGNTHYKNKRYRSAAQYYTQALFFTPWPHPMVLDRMDDCLRGLDVNVRAIVYDDLLDLRSTSELYDSTPSLLAQCYGNRSAALFEMGEHEGVALDIERAIAAGYKKPQVFKLYKRHYSSLLHLNRLQEALKVVEEYKDGIKSMDSGLTKEEKQRCEKEIRFMLNEIRNAGKKLSLSELASKPEEKQQQLKSSKSDLITIETTPKYGKHIVSTDVIQLGACVVSEPPYVCVLNTEYKYTHCATCFTACLTLIPCIACILPGYCSYSCMYRAFRYHFIECKNVYEWSCMPWIVQLVMRMLFVAPKHIIKNLIIQGWRLNSIDAAIDKAINGIIIIPDKDISVLSLVSHRGKYSDRQQRIFIERDSLVPLEHIKENMLRFFDLKDIHVKTLYDMFRYHMSQLRFNALAIKVNTLETSDRIDWEGVAVRDVVPQKLGYGVYLTGSLFNHSCDPNVFFRFEDNNLKVIAHQGSIKGEGLFHCYGPQLGKQKTSERQALLEKGYMFTCTCKACHNPEKSLVYREEAWDALACPECKGLIPSSVLSPIEDCLTNCDKCGKEFTLQSIIQELNTSRTLFEQGMAERRLHKLLQCEKIQRVILYCNNLELSRTRDAIAYFQMIEGNPKRSFDSCMESYNAVKNIFGIDSVEATEELCKLTQVLFRSSKPSDALKTASNALPLLELFYGPKHVDVIQIKHMRDVVESGKRL